MDENLALVQNYLNRTGEHIFLTGRAGTGKTTFLRNFREQSWKRMVVLAPTGVAAVNAGGMTIHSFFQMPFGPYLGKLSNHGSDSYFKIRKERIKLIRSLDLLVIDEISMVRADLLDAVDDMLRHYRRSNQSFGGLQLLMIGDVHQLAPVARDEEWTLLKEVYDSPYFFSSRALHNTTYRTISLTHVFRQTDRRFLELLNAVRDNCLHPEMLEKLNERYVPNCDSGKYEGYITLTTHNAQANAINQGRLQTLDSPEFCYSAETSGIFPENSYPTSKELLLKEGAQVMFVKNDSTGQQRYYNGKLATVTEVSAKNIQVRLEGSGDLIDVGLEEWSNTRYEIDEKTGEIVEYTEGIFRQYPLKLAWAITVHKSQGLTFDRVILDIAEAFAHGQVYVALSRCRSLEGIILRTPLRMNAIKTDKWISRFNQTVENQRPTEEDLKSAEKEYFLNLVSELFDFQNILGDLRRLRYICDEYCMESYPNYCSAVSKASVRCFSDMAEVGIRFQGQLQRMAAESENAERDASIQERIRKAATYFIAQMEDWLMPLVEETPPTIDNASVSKQLTDAFVRFSQSVREKHHLLTASKESFAVDEYLRARTEYVIREDKTPVKKKRILIPEDIERVELYEQLVAWRAQTAKEKAIPAYTVLTQKALIALCKKPARSIVELSLVKGIGIKTIQKYGSELMEIIQEFVEPGKVQLRIPE